MCLPVLLCSFSPLDLLVHFQLVVVQLQVPVRYDVVVPQTSSSRLLHLLFLQRESICMHAAVSYLLFISRRSLVWSSEVVLLHGHVTQDIVVNVGVFAWTEVPGLLFGVVWAFFKSLEFVFKVNYVEGLFVTQSTILLPVNLLNIPYWKQELQPCGLFRTSVLWTRCPCRCRTE